MSGHEGGDEQKGGDVSPATFANMMVRSLLPAVAGVDDSVKEVVQSQEHLSAQIHRLEQALVEFQKLSSLPLLTPYSDKIVATRKRLVNVAADVQKINARLDGIRALVRKKELNPSTASPAPVHVYFKPHGAAGDDIATAAASSPSSSSSSKSEAPTSSVVSSHDGSTAAASASSSSSSTAPLSSSSAQTTSASASSPSAAVSLAGLNKSLVNDLLSWEEDRATIPGPAAESAREANASESVVSKQQPQPQGHPSPSTQQN